MPRRAPRTPEEEAAYQLKWGEVMRRTEYEAASDALPDEMAAEYEAELHEQEQAADRDD